MTEQRTAQSRPPQGKPTEAEIAEAIALILAGQVVVASADAAIASLLKLIPGLPDLASLDDDVSAPSEAIARLVSGISRDTQGRSEGLTAASSEASNLAHRAHYAIEAVKRIATKVKNGDAIGDALSAEHTYLRQHLEASEARTQGQALNEAAARRWGSVLSWNHAASRTGAASHRPSHVAADGANFDVRNPPESTDGMLPGMALHCDCLPGAPIAGARMLS